MKFAVLLLLVLCGTSLADQCPTFTTERNFNIEKYLGVWYVVSRLPNIFLLSVRCDNATYTLNSNGSVTLFNQGVDAQGQPSTIGGLATVIDPDVPGAFRVLFSTSVFGAYNVLATDYKRYASVYSCSILPNTNIKLEYAFIISRDKSLEPNKLEKAKKPFTTIGVNVTQFIPIPQDC